MNTVNRESASTVEELHQSNADLRNLYESTQIATVFLDASMTIRSYTPAVTGIFDLTSGDCGRPVDDIAHHLEDVDLRRDVRKVLDEREPLERSVRLRGGKVHYLMCIKPYRASDDEIDGAVVTFVDITGVVAAEEKQRVLVSELNHRVRNMLQVVIGLANQTLHRSSDLEEFEYAFMGRMQALARAYELLSRDGWHKVPMEELVRSQLSAFGSEGARYSAGGEDVDLTSNAALALGLVVYELGTNATKYGALSAPAGRVDVNWGMERKNGDVAQLVVHWSESGGPPVTEPTRSGFGSELVKRQLKYELHGNAELEFRESGLHVTLSVPASDVLLARQPPAHDSQ